MWWRNLLRGGIVREVWWESEVPAREALVEERKERLAALTENTSANSVDVGDDLRAGHQHRSRRSARKRNERG